MTRGERKKIALKKLRPVLWAMVYTKVLLASTKRALVRRKTTM